MSNTCPLSSSWYASAHLALVFEPWRHPPSDAVLTPTTSGRFVEGGSVLFFPYRSKGLTHCEQTEKPDWNDRSISLSSKIRLMHPLVTAIFLYACESWTLTAEFQRRIQAMEMRCYCNILRISYKDHVTNKEVRAKIQKQSNHTKTS